ncbi:hypothetical protein MLD38_013058 [Melastoma candidum]|uniref:Uncharacterized protein n=1 Tax=Melastoma candidum TaxID=119954 RepID=A0ACB9RBZ5_9MYRT|nr:hypothetical protein MLD38_013058 [Melastoma candidum]
MSRLKTTLVIVIISLVMAQEAEIYGVSGGSPAVEAATIDCQGKCSYRCSKASRYKMCMRACNTCCERCNCVPPGTSGNEDQCPCYANMTTHGGRHKCP